MTTIKDILIHLPNEFPRKLEAAERAVFYYILALLNSVDLDLRNQVSGEMGSSIIFAYLRVHRRDVNGLPIRGRRDAVWTLHELGEHSPEYAGIQRITTFINQVFCQHPARVLNIQNWVISNPEAKAAWEASKLTLHDVQIAWFEQLLANA